MQIAGALETLRSVVTAQHICGRFVFLLISTSVPTLSCTHWSVALMKDYLVHSRYPSHRVHRISVGITCPLSPLMSTRLWSTGCVRACMVSAHALGAHWPRESGKRFDLWNLHLRSLDEHKRAHTDSAQLYEKDTCYKPGNFGLSTTGLDHKFKPLFVALNAWSRLVIERLKHGIISKFHSKVS